MTQTFPSLKWLNTFRLVAHTGSVQITAEQSRQSVSTVSHQLQCLEKHVGMALLDHSCRPMVLTAEGVVYLRHAEAVLDTLGRARAELVGMAPASLSRLRFAMIEDFESDIGPEMTRLLADAHPHCQFIHYTRVSYEILQLMRTNDLDIGVAAQPRTPLPKVEELPLLRDPFVLAVPAHSQTSARDFLEGRSGLPLLRYTRNQIMGELIEAQLTRLRIDLENTFELDSTSSIMSLIAQGSGWAITTPCNIAGVRTQLGPIKLLPFPGKAFSRTVSVFVAEPHLSPVGQMIATALRSLLSTRSVRPMTDAYPWLGDSYRLIPEDHGG